ncbi:MAG: tyrosine-type recombinase/integrase [Clostridia bacterium]|nr:tyrosine-type recombinase/integrase [Clostridia bacterium]
MGKPKSRGNGQGTAYKRKGQTTWTAEVVVGWRLPKDDAKPPIPIKKTRGGFVYKKDALKYCDELLKDKPTKKKISLQGVYEEWEEKYAPRIVKSTMAGYKSAYMHFSNLHQSMIDTITAQDLQDCMDACTAGKRTHQQMKVVAGLLWGYAFDCKYVDRKITDNLYTGKGKSTPWEPIDDQEVEIIRQAIGKEQYADYVYALCYLGFRPGEFLALKKSDLHTENGITYLQGGSKTEAGIGRKVPVPQAIIGIIRNRLNVVGTDYLFPHYTTNRKGEFTGYKKMRDQYCRESVFKPMMARLGIAEGKVPYGARHTYSDKLKDAVGDDKTKAAIFGHTDYEFTKKRYQSTNLEEIKAVGDSIK